MKYDMLDRLLILIVVFSMCVLTAVICINHTNKKIDESIHKTYAVPDSIITNYSVTIYTK